MPSLAIAANPPATSTAAPDYELQLGPEFLGEIKGTAAVSAAGNATYTIPLELPPGTAGMRPSLSFQYNSNMKNGLLGVGWFLQGATSKITRCAQNLSQDGVIKQVQLNSDDKFCLDGQRLVVVNGGTYGASGTEYGTEIDSILRVTSYGQAPGTDSGPLYFEVESPNGRTSYYGNTNDSLIEAQGKDAIATWALNRVEDEYRNYYEIIYEENNAQGAYQVEKIEYTGNLNKSMNPSVTIEFGYESRPDHQFFYRAGAKMREYQ